MAESGSTIGNTAAIYRYDIIAKKPNKVPPLVYNTAFDRGINPDHIDEILQQKMRTIQQ